MIYCAFVRDRIRANGCSALRLNRNHGRTTKLSYWKIQSTHSWRRVKQLVLDYNDCGDFLARFMNCWKWIIRSHCKLVHHKNWSLWQICSRVASASLVAFGDLNLVVSNPTGECLLSCLLHSRTEKIIPARWALFSAVDFCQDFTCVIPVRRILLVAGLAVKLTATSARALLVATPLASPMASVSATATWV